MQFLHPEMFMLLGLIPVIILLHLLKPKPKQVEVTNLYLWQELFKERSHNVTFRQLKKNLPLLFQILIVILAALALARPVWLYFIQKHGDMILIIDTSASMKTKGESGTRFDVAREKAYELIEEHGNHQEILIVEAGREPVIASGFVEETAQAKALVKALKPSDAPGHLEKAIYLALSFVDPTSNDIIYLITDGAGSNFSELLQIHPNIVPVITPGGEKNIGITKFEFRQELDRQNVYEIMLEVKNFTQEPLECPLHLSIDKTSIIDTTITFEPQEKQLLIFPYSGIITGIAKVELEIEDDFTIDNVAYLSLTTSEDIWILLVSQENYFLEKLLELYPNVLVNTVKEIIPSSWEKQVMGHDIVIVDRMDFPETGKGNFLLLNASSPSIPLKTTGQIAFPNVLDWDARHPLMANVNLSGLAIEQAAKFQADPILHPVIESSETELMYTYEKDGMRAVILGFDITRSNLPLKVAFPVMISNILTWLNPHKLSFSISQTRAGEPYSIYLNPFTENFSIRPPGGRWEKHQMTSNPVTYTETGKVGIYTISEDKKQRYFTVNLVDESESDIRIPDLERPSRGSDEVVDAEKIATQQPLWAAFLFSVLAITMIEWYVWLKTG